MKHLTIIAAMGLFSTLFANAGAGVKVDPYPAPKAEGVDQNGKTVKLDDFYKKGLTLVYFYPKAGTPGCTAQACSLRDAYEDLSKAGVQVIGVSTDTVEAQKKFEQKQKLPFTLLADSDKKLVKAFGVSTLLGFSSRQAFLIKDGNVIWHDKSASTAEQAADVLRVVKG
jgi:peroxiredoxin Q/BCP